MEEKKNPTLSNLALKTLVAELQILEQGFVNNVQSLENGWLKIKIHTKQGDRTLLVADTIPFISNKSIPAKQNPGGFSALLRKYLYNQRVISLKQHSADRIVVMEFPNHTLILELFSKGNLILCDKDLKIVKAMRKEEWKDRKVETGELYKFPSSRGIDPVEENAKSFFTKMQENKKTSFGAVVDILNAAPAALEFAFEENNIDKKINAVDLTKKQTDALLKTVQKTYSNSSKESYLSGGVLYSAPLGLVQEHTFPTVNDALNELIDTTQEKKRKSEEKEVTQKQPKERKVNHEKKLEIIQKQIEGLTIKEKEMKEKGDAVYLHYAQVKEILAAIQKGKAKGLSSKEIMEKINSITPSIIELDLEKSKLKLKL